DKRARTTLLLHLGNHLQRERSFARRLWAVNLDHAATGQTANTQGDVQTQ
ncbi:MAG: hypothetical protein RL420_1242, partial [Pseudomonadota bacterium]